MISDTRGRRQVRHLLAAHHQHDRAQARRDLGEARVEGGRARRGGRLDAQVGTSAKPRCVATFEAKLPSPRNSSGFMAATTMASGVSRPAAASAACAASAMRSAQRFAAAPDARHPRAGHEHVAHTPAGTVQPQHPGAMVTADCRVAVRTSTAAADARESAGRALPTRHGPKARERGTRRRRCGGPRIRPADPRGGGGGGAATPELADEPQQVRALQPERARRVRAVAAHLMQRRLDQPPLELARPRRDSRAARSPRDRVSARRDRSPWPRTSSNARCHRRPCHSRAIGARCGRASRAAPGERAQRGRRALPCAWATTRGPSARAEGPRRAAAGASTTWSPA